MTKIKIKNKGDDINKKVELESNKQGNGSILEKILKKRSEKKEEIKKRDEYQKKVPLRESPYEEVNEVALEIAERFPYNEVFDAVDNKKSPHIHGWLQDNYRNFQWLVDNCVMEVASWYSKNRMEKKVFLIKIVSGIKLRDYKMSRVELEEMYRLDNYPKQPFKNIMFLSEEHLDDALYWIEDAEWIIDGEDVRVNLGRFGGELIGFTDWNLPVVLVTYIPFRNKGIYKAKMDSSDLNNVIVDSRLKLIHTYRTMIKTLESKVDEKTREAKQWKKMYSDFTKDINLEARKRIASTSYANTSTGITKKYYDVNKVLVVVVVVLFIIMILGWIF